MMAHGNAIFQYRQWDRIGSSVSQSIPSLQDQTRTIKSTSSRSPIYSFIPSLINTSSMHTRCPITAPDLPEHPHQLSSRKRKPPRTQKPKVKTRRYHQMTRRLNVAGFNAAKNQNEWRELHETKEEGVYPRVSPPMPNAGHYLGGYNKGKTGI
jgi:hypothetical protein